MIVVQVILYIIGIILLGSLFILSAYTGVLSFIIFIGSMMSIIGGERDEGNGKNAIISSLITILFIIIVLLCGKGLINLSNDLISLFN